MNISKEVKKLTERLKSYALIAEENPDSKENVKKTCRDEIEIAEILVSSKSKSTPLFTQTIFKMALERQMPQNVKNLVFSQE